MTEPKEQDGEQPKTVEEAKAVNAKAAKKKGVGPDGEPVPKEAGVFKNFARVLGMSDIWDRLLMGLCAFCGIGVGAAMPLIILVFGNLTGNFVDYFKPGENVPTAVFMHEILRNTRFMFYIGLGRFCLAYVSFFSVRISGLRISARLRLAYLRALLKQPVGLVDTISPGKIASRLTTNSNTIQMGITQQFAQCFQALSLLVGLYILAFYRGPVLTLVASASLLLIVLIYGICLPFIFTNTRDGDKIKEKASSLSFEIFESIRIVNAFGAHQRLAKSHYDIMQDLRNTLKRAAPVMGVLLSVMFFSIYASIALTFWFGIRQVLQGHLEGAGEVITVLFAIMFVTSTMGSVFAPIMAMTRAASAAAELFITIDAPVPNTSGLKDPDVKVQSDIVFKDVTFAYPTRPDTVVLNKLNVTFETGKTTAIVGPSGSGKSTVVGLLERWYQPTNPKDIKPKEDDDKKKPGENELTEVKVDNKNETENISDAGVGTQSAVDITQAKGDEASAEFESKFEDTGVFIGSVSLNDIDAKWWRSNIGLVQQEPFMFNDSIYNNVVWGLSGTPSEDLSEEEKMKMVEAACQESYAHEFIQQLPDKYNTMVGEGGLKISGGQRQRLAIARAIIKQPLILILDEATSAIDVRTERIVQQALDRVSEGRTTITIAHRLSTIKRANKIVVIRNGIAVEQGTHEELISTGGVYSTLVTAQNLEMDTDDSEKDIQQNEADQIRDEEVLERQKSHQLETEKTWKERGVIRSFGKLMLEQKHSWFLRAMILIGCAGAGVAYPMQSYFFAHLVNVFTMVGNALLAAGNYWSLRFFIMAIGLAVAYFLAGVGSHLVSIDVSSHYRQEYLENLLRKRIPFFDAKSNSAGTLTSRLSTDSTQIQELLGTNMSLVIIAVFNMIGSIIISFYFGWKLSLVGVFSIMPVILATGYIRVDMEVSFEKLNAAVFAESSQFGSEAIAAFRTVTSLLMEDMITERFDNLLRDHVLKAYRKARWSTLVIAFSVSAEMFCQALCFYYGGTLLAKHEYNIVQFFVVYMSALISAQAAGSWFSLAPNLVDASAAANRILSVRPTKEELASSPPKMSPGEGAVSVEFQDVEFAYRDRGVSVLQNVNLKIEAGQFAALVGATGCGKSTMISLLERFYDPTGGQIMFGNTDITTVDTATYRLNLSLVAQESTLYDGTIRENVALSVEQEQATSEAITEACKSAQIHDFITSLPDGYNTVIGPRGIALSGGQRQRVALARALLRKPQLLLLDEATSNLDSESEKQVQDAIERTAGEGGHTIIAVAHRLATIQNADIIFVLGSGRVLEKGNHAELIAQRGVYYHMCQAQALDR